MNRLTVDLGVRYDRQWGEALPSTLAANSAFPNLVPGITFDGYDAPFHWNDITPRVGMTYALDEGNKTILRASFSRNAGQLTAVGTYVGYANPSSGAGWVEYPWMDLNGDHLAQTNEVHVQSPPPRFGQWLQHGQSDRRELRRTGSIPTSRRRRAWASSSVSIGS